MDVIWKGFGGPVLIRMGEERDHDLHVVKDFLYLRVSLIWMIKCSRKRSKERSRPNRDTRCIIYTELYSTEHLCE